MRRGVVGIIFDKNKRLLILHRKLNWSGWELPKGGVEENENEEEALHREIGEETGLKVEIVSKLSYEISYVSDGEVKQKVFLARCKEGAVKLSGEHDNFVWVDFEKAMKLLTHDNQKKAL